VGNCAAVGTFENANGYYEAFAQTQTSGQWDTALPATFGGGIQNANPDSSFASVSCPSVGNCIAAGRLKNSSGYYQAFTQTQTNGVWDTATPVTFGVGIQSMYPDSSFSSISCTSVGECVAVGKFKNTNYDDEAFMQTQSNGVWGTAIPAAFSDGIQNERPQSRFNSVSCASVGNCVAVGGFSNTVDANEAFTQTLVNGVWANARPAIFGAGIQNASPGAGLDLVTCLSPGNCVAAGQFRNINGDNEAFTQTQANGQWGNAVPARFANGIQSATPNSLFWAVSCASVGNCVAAGQYTNPNGDNEAFTQNQINGQWATAIPATFAVGVQNQNPASYFGSFSCAPDGSCVGVGEFANASGYYEAFSQKITLTLEPPAVAPAPKTTNVTKVVGFATNSSALTAAQKVALKALVAKSGKKAAFVITGTAGKLPGLSDKKVKALAIKRGEIVKAYLVKLGVNKSKITVRAQITNQGIAPKTKVLARYLESK
jgi:outer membrane protein OmpA-like peptidoglycan-associated protein